MNCDYLLFLLNLSNFVKVKVRRFKILKIFKINELRTKPKSNSPYLIPAHYWHGIETSGKLIKYQRLQLEAVAVHNKVRD